MQINQLINAILRKSSPWAIMPESIESFLNLMRDKDYLSAVMNPVNQSIDQGDIYEVVDDSAIIRIRGVIFAEENCNTIVGMGTSNDYLQSALELAAEDPSINRIILDVNSPGGEVAKTDATASLIREIRKTKEVIAVVEDMAASAAYWIASAASRIVIAETASVGSIGVRAIIEDDSQAMESAGIKKYSYISNQSPLKDFNPNSQESVNDLQSQLDYLASIFINAVAIGRSTDPVNVVNYYGRGGIIYGREAVRLGMADEIGTMNDILKSFRPNNINTTGGSVMQTQAETIDLESLRLDAIKAERERVQKLVALPATSEEEKSIVQAAIESGETAESIAIKLLQVKDAQTRKLLDARQSDAKQIPVIDDHSPEAKKEDNISKIADVINALNSRGGVK